MVEETNMENLGGSSNIQLSFRNIEGACINMHITENDLSGSALQA